MNVLSLEILYYNGGMFPKSSRKEIKPQFLNLVQKNFFLIFCQFFIFLFQIPYRSLFRPPKFYAGSINAGPINAGPNNAGPEKLEKHRSAIFSLIKDDFVHNCSY